MAEYNWWDDRTVEDNDEHFCPLSNNICYGDDNDCQDCEAQIEEGRKVSKIIDNGWLEKEANEAKIDMPLEDVYRHIKASYLHHKLERNAVFLPKAELIALMCIQKVIAENDKEFSELPNIIDNGDKIGGYVYSYKTDSEGVPYINIDSVKAMLAKAASAQSVKRGKWVSDKCGMHCSCCNKPPHTEEGQCGCQTVEDYILSDFCPKCGADMRGDENG